MVAGVDTSLAVPVVIFVTVSREGCDWHNGRLRDVSIGAGVADAVVEFAVTTPIANRLNHRGCDVERP